LNTSEEQSLYDAMVASLTEELNPKGMTEENLVSDMAMIRIRLLLQLGYKNMRRRSEICAFMFEDVKTLPNGKHAVLLRKSKTDQFVEGKLIPFSDELFEMISHWQGEIKQTDGYILISFKRDLSVRESLDPAALNKILKAL